MSLRDELVENERAASNFFAYIRWCLAKFFISQTARGSPVVSKIAMVDASSPSVSSMLHDAEAMRHEEEIARNPYSLKLWLAYLEFRKAAPYRDRRVIHERALKFLPRSFKLWKTYLTESVAALEGRSVLDKRYAVLIRVYERALVHLHKMPRVWLDYCALLIKLCRTTSVRRTFDRALQALPITQHEGLEPVSCLGPRPGVANRSARLRVSAVRPCIGRVR